MLSMLSEKSRWQLAPWQRVACACACCLCVVGLSGMASESLGIGSGWHYRAADGSWKVCSEAPAGVCMPVCGERLMIHYFSKPCEW